MVNSFFAEILKNYNFLIPEFSLIFCIFLNIISLFFDQNKKSNISIILSIGFVFFGLVFGFKNLINFPLNESIGFFNSFYSVSRNGFVFKLLILLALFFIHLFSLSLNEKKSFINKFGIAEISVLLNFSSLGAIFAISSSNFIFLYVSLELQALSSYILVSLKRNSSVSMEASLKYFVLGVISSSLMLLGISFIYFGFESFSFHQIYSNILLNQGHLTGSSIGSSKIGIIGIFLVFSGLFFKLSAFPFHSWLADIYNGASNFVIAFFGTVPKIMAGFVLYNLYHFVFIGRYAEYGQKIIAFFAFLSLVFGALLAVNQKNFKRLLAYSGVANSGFILVAILGVSQISFDALNIYFIGYMLGFFGLLSFAMFYWSENSDEKDNYQISKIHGAAKKYKIESLMLAFCLFSIAGIPPFIGFFGKFQILFSAFSKFNIFLIVTALFSSVISLVYYLGILKSVYFANYEQFDISVSNEYRKLLIFFGLSTILSLGLFLINFI